MANGYLSELKLLQIAYNIGQFQAEILNNTYDKKIIQFIEDNNMYEMKTYIKF